MHKFRITLIVFLPIYLGSSVVECLTRDRGAAGRASLASMRCVLEKEHNYPSLVLDQPRKTRPFITERLLTGRKESNKTNQKNCHIETFFEYP